MTSPAHIHTLVRGVVVVDEYVLVARCKGALNTFLPGGHIALREGLKAGLVRELAEEMGLVAEVGRYLGAVEHQWRGDEQIQHGSTFAQPVERALQSIDHVEESATFTGLP